MESDERKSPWAEFDEERSAAALAHKELRQRLGREAREAQEEAYQLWCAWEEEQERENYEPEQ